MSYEKQIEEFLANGGEIKQAVNSGKAVSFNRSDADVLESHNRRKTAKAKSERTYTTCTPCKKCGTSIRSTASNLCLECDRRRNRKNTAPLERLGKVLLESGSQTVTINGVKYKISISEV